MTPEQRKARVKALTKQKMSAGAIADKLGVSQPTVFEDLNEMLTNKELLVGEMVIGKDGVERPSSPQPGTRKRGRKPMAWASTS